MQVYARMGFPLLIFEGFSDWSISCLTEPNQQNQRCKRAREKPVGNSSITQAKTNSNHEHQSRSEQHWSRSIKPITFWFQCYALYFEGDEAVIKKIIKGRSPTIRHVSRTHRVALDWLFDRIILVSKIQIRYIDTKHQLAVILTKGDFTRDEWNNLLHLFNISHFSSNLAALRIPAW